MMIGRRHSPGWSVDLGPRADADPLAREIRRRVVANLEHGGRLRAFQRMWGTVVVVAVLDEAFGAAHTTLTLRFDWGRLMIHEGRVGRPDVTLWGSPAGILRLGDLTRWPRNSGASQVASGLSESAESGASEPPRSRVRRWSLRGRFRPDPGQHLKIYGALRRPRFVLRLARLLAQP
jgi:hypothetical protein